MKRIVRLLSTIFDAPTGAAVAILWFIGAAFATFAGLLAMTRPGAGPYAAFLIVAVGLIFMGALLLRTWLWAMAASFVLLCGQVVGVVGTTLELLYGIDAGKAAELRALGFEPKLGVAVNLAFSFSESCILVAAVLRAAKSLRTKRAN